MEKKVGWGSKKPGELFAGERGGLSGWGLKVDSVILSLRIFTQLYSVPHCD